MPYNVTSPAKNIKGSLSSLSSSSTEERRDGIVELLIRVHVILITGHKLFIYLGHPKLCCRFGFWFLNGTL